MDKKVNHHYDVISLVLGIASILLFLNPTMGFVMAMCGITLGLISKTEKSFSGYAISGFIFSGIGIIISLILFFGLIMYFQLLKDPQFGPVLNQQFRQMQEMAPQSFQEMQEQLYQQLAPYLQ